MPGLGRLLEYRRCAWTMDLGVADGAAAALIVTGVVAMNTHDRDRHDGTLTRLRGAALAIDHHELDGATGMVFASR